MKHSLGNVALKFSCRSESDNNTCSTILSELLSGSSDLDMKDFRI